MSGNHTISDVSRIAGIPKDLLRMWERRYGYPRPARDESGNRVYTDEQLDKLILVRQLVDQGKRPGKLMGLELKQLRSLQQRPQEAPDIALLVQLLRTEDTTAVRHWFRSRLLGHGLRGFVHNVMAPVTRALGEAWSTGELEIHDEHLYTELVSSLVRQSLSEYYREDGEPRVMLTTVQGERHSLGLLMVEALLRVGGAEVIPFGTEMPFRDIEQAAQRQKVDIVGLSFSSHFKPEDAMAMIGGLRQLLDPGIGLWIGGAAFDSGLVAPPGVDLLSDLYELERALVRWKQG